MWLSPTRPGFDSRRGNIFLALQNAQKKIYIYIGSTGTWTRIVRIRTWSANQLHYRTNFTSVFSKKTCLDRGSNTGPLDLQSNALPTELSKQVIDTWSHLVVMYVHSTGSRASNKRSKKTNQTKKKAPKKPRKRKAYWRIWTIDLSLTKRMLYP